MAGRRADFQETIGRSKRQFTFSFPTNGAADPVSIAQDASKPIQSVVYSATGVYTCTLLEGLPAVIDVFPTLRMATPDGSDASPGVYVQASKTFIVQTLTAAGAGVAIAANANNRVSVTVSWDEATTATL